MSSYILKRILLIIPTLLGILLLNFLIIQFAPGGPVEHVIAKLTSQTQLADNLTTNNNEVTTNINHNSKYAGSKGLDPEIIAEIEELYGFNQSISSRFFLMLKNFMSFDFGESFFKGEKVVNLIIERLPISISLGLWSTLIIYLISIPLGIKKALYNGSKFDFYRYFCIPSCRAHCRVNLG